MSLTQTFERVLARHDELRDTLNQVGLSADQMTKLSKEYSDVLPVAEAILELRKTIAETKDAEELLTDPDFKEEAQTEINRLKKEIPEMERAVQLLLLPKDIADERNAILEIRAGTGGDEAALFAGLLFDMYRKYASVRGWRFEVMDVSESDLGGLKDATALISGKGVFARMKFESGVHRVQRVPQTETQGRVHTSAATVAVLPEMEEVDIKIDEKDLRVDTYRASGKGGQHVNKTDSAVRITHLPTGIAVAMQESRSQLKNRVKALKVLRSRLYEKQREERDQAYAETRKEKIGSGDRSERIRTYNFPQSRVTDHRIELTLYKLDEVIAGSMDDVIDPLIQHDEALKIAALSEN